MPENEWIYDWNLVGGTAIAPRCPFVTAASLGRWTKTDAAALGLCGAASASAS